MAKSYVLNEIYNIIYRNYGIKSKITEKENSNDYEFNLGKIGKFVLYTNKFQNQADLNAFILQLTTRINNVLSA